MHNSSSLSKSWHRTLLPFNSKKILLTPFFRLSATLIQVRHRRPDRIRKNCSELSCAPSHKNPKNFVTKCRQWLYYKHQSKMKTVEPTDSLSPGRPSFLSTQRLLIQRRLHFLRAAAPWQKKRVENMWISQRLHSQRGPSHHMLLQTPHLLPTELVQEYV